MKIKTSKDGFEKEIDIFSDEGFETISDLWTKLTFNKKIVYEPRWLGMQIIQLPSDIVMMQELIWDVKPDVIVETGIAHGGSAVQYASILEIIGTGKVIGVDIEIREHNRVNIEKHPLFHRIELIEGSSIDEKIVRHVQKHIKENDKVLVVLDSNHTYKHVKKEIEMYSQFVSKDSYLVVMDTIQEQLWDTPPGKPEWKDDNPAKAAREFIEINRGWKVDDHYNRLNVTYSPNGFIKKVV